MQMAVKHENRFPKKWRNRAQVYAEIARPILGSNVHEIIVLNKHFHPAFFFENIILSIGNEAIATKSTRIYTEYSITPGYVLPM